MQNDFKTAVTISCAFVKAQIDLISNSKHGSVPFDCFKEMNEKRTTPVQPRSGPK